MLDLFVVFVILVYGLRFVFRLDWLWWRCGGGFSWLGLCLWLVGRFVGSFLLCFCLLVVLIVCGGFGFGWLLCLLGFFWVVVSLFFGLSGIVCL